MTNIERIDAVGISELEQKQNTTDFCSVMALG